ncbi:hypothetical protein [Burkholderia sp. Nafp2/4-1b]|uniref:hypothetical protein n=1 Tax=Burkholderia sp. Nafp2/4-1b TaxID=2116686 RepID=UPI0013CE8B76|nr:hypothetical protein [Burkholderia sp. Nafp2/4-1b]
MKKLLRILFVFLIVMLDMSTAHAICSAYLRADGTLVGAISDGCSIESSKHPSAGTYQLTIQKPGTGSVVSCELTLNKSASTTAWVVNGSWDDNHLNPFAASSLLTINTSAEAAGVLNVGQDSDVNILCYP